MRWLTGLMILGVATGCLNPKDNVPAPSPTVSVTPGPPQAVIHVRPDGDDSSAGTVDAPMATIQAAVAALETQFGTGLVRVSVGTYVGDGSIGVDTHVILTGGVSLYGGYSADFSSRDAATNLTTIQDSSSTGGTGGVNADPNAALEIAGPGVSASTVVDGFVIEGGDGDSTTAVLVRDGAAPTISNNEIRGGTALSTSGVRAQTGSTPALFGNDVDGGTATQGTSVAVVVSRAHVLIQGNTISGGSAVSSSRGVNITGTATLTGNTIHGGTGNGPIGVSGGHMSVINNVIYSGDSSGGATTFAVQITGDTSFLRNNTIIGGTNTGDTIGLDIPATSPGTEIQNNIITTVSGANRRCVDLGVATQLEHVQNNNLFDCPDALLQDTAGNDLTTIADVNLITVNGTAAGNVSVDPAFEGASDFHLSAATLTTVTEGGLDLTSFVLTDRDEATRTAPVSIGAYELD